MLHRYAGRADELDEAQLEELGRLASDCEADRLMYLRVALQAGRNDDNSGTGPMSKVFGSELAQRFVRWAVDVFGQDAMYPEAHNRDQLAADIEEQVRVATVLSIIGGTNEVQRNTAAQRALNLPRGG
jgi:alkylation response protein AidB-like acyl-CoA dehydrogenase